MFDPNIPEIPVVIITLGAQHMARASKDSSLTLEETDFLGYSRFSKPPRKKNVGAWGMYCKHDIFV